LGEWGGFLETNLLYYNRTLGHNNRQRRAVIPSLKSTRNSETVDIRNIRSILVITNIDKLQFDRYRFCLAGVGRVGRFFSFFLRRVKEGSVQSSISNLILELVKIYKNVRKIVFTPRLGNDGGANIRYLYDDMTNSCLEKALKHTYVLIVHLLSGSSVPIHWGHRW